MLSFYKYGVANRYETSVEVWVDADWNKLAGWLRLWYYTAQSKPSSINYKLELSNCLNQALCALGQIYKTKRAASVRLLNVGGVWCAVGLSERDSLTLITYCPLLDPQLKVLRITLCINLKKNLHPKWAYRNRT